MKDCKLNDQWYTDNCDKCSNEWDCDIADIICVEYLLVPKAKPISETVKDYIGVTYKCKHFQE